MSNPLKDIENKEETGCEDRQTRPVVEGKGLAKGLFSILGLIAIGVALTYGLPHLSAALKAISSKETSPDSKLSEVSAEPPEKPTASPSGGKNLISLPDKVVGGIEQALRAKHRDEGEFFLQDTKYAESLNQVRAVFELGGESRELIFNYIASYNHFRAEVEDSELKKFFSRAPTFVWSNH